MDHATATTPSTKHVTAFFGLVLIVSVPCYILAAFVPQDTVMFAALTLALAPITAALILTYREHRGPGARVLLKRSFDYKRIARKVWYLPILLLMPVLFSLALGIVTLVNAPVPDPLLPVAATPVALAAFFLFALFEEVGWMGSVFDPMQERWNAQSASLLLGVLWAIWHLPFYLAAGHDPLRIAAQSLALLAMRLLIVWIYNNTGRSVFATILIHAVYNVCTIAFPSFYISLGHLITSILIVVAAVIVALRWDSETLTRYRRASR